MKAVIKSAQKTADGIVALSIEFSPSEGEASKPSFTIPLKFSNLADIEIQCRNQIRYADVLAATKKSVDDYLAVSHVNEVIVDTSKDPLPPVPTVEEIAGQESAKAKQIADQQFAADLSKLRGLQSRETMGFTVEDDGEKLLKSLQDRLDADETLNRFFESRF